MNRRTLTLSVVLTFQGIYYLVTGIWPIVSIDTFMQVTGPKTDIWLVKMVGLLTASIAITLLVAVKTKNLRNVFALACCAAISYLAIDLFYVLRGTIDEIYLTDAAMELVILIGLMILRNRT